MPNRILKESICTSETIHRLTLAERDFFYRLIVMCDDYGRMDARPRILRARCFPLELDTVKDKDIGLWLTRLKEVALLELYEVEEQPYLHMITWEKHQQIRAKRSRYPAPCEGMPVRASNGNHLLADDGICTRNPIQSNPIQSTSQLSKTVSSTPPRLDGLFTPETESFRLAKVLRDLILARNPKAKVPQLASGPFQAWCLHIDSLLRVDGHDASEIEAVMEWCQQDSFWHRNILGTRGLSDKYDKLYLGWQESLKSKVVQISNSRERQAMRATGWVDSSRAYDPARDGY